MLHKRILVAIAILVPIVGLIYADYSMSAAAPGAWLYPLGLVIALVGANELLTLLNNRAERPEPWSVYAGVALVWIGAGIPLFWPLSGQPYPPDCPLGELGWPLGAAAVAVPLAFIAEMRKYEQPGGVIVRIAVCLFVVAYIGVQSIFLIALRTFDGNQTGMAALVSLILVVKMSDTGAYTFGRLFGKRKLAPKLSPGKTIAGAIGGLATGCAASCVFFQWIAPAMTGDAGSGAVWGPLLYGAILTIAGMIGDLSESLIKRDMEQKDSSTWMPGLGGVLDVIDSLLVAAPIAYLCWAAELVPG